MKDPLLIKYQHSLKRAETLILSEAERANIIQQAENAGYTWSKSKDTTQVNDIKRHENLMRRETSLIIHASTLVEYIKAQRIPRGLRSTLTPILLKDDLLYQERWTAICNQFSLDLMVLTIQHLQKAITEIKEEIKKVDIECKITNTIEKYDEIQKNLQENISKFKAQLMQNKCKKIERDTRDYKFNRVYTWAEERTTARKW